MSFRFLEQKCNPKEMSPLTLAFVGDCVFELFVREMISCQANRPAKKLHELSVNKVCCKCQSTKFDKIKEFLTEEEFTIYKRGRNAHTAHKPKNASRAEYSSATGLEALFGFLYLSGNIERVRELFFMMYDDKESRDSHDKKAV